MAFSISPCFSVVGNVQPRKIFCFPIVASPLAMDSRLAFFSNAESFGLMELVIVVPAFGAVAAEVEQLFFRLRIHMAVRKQHIRPPVVPKTRVVP